ncbi:unnamed protein product [Brassica oleracea]
MMKKISSHSFNQSLRFSNVSTTYCFSYEKKILCAVTKLEDD